MAMSPFDPCPGCGNRLFRVERAGSSSRRVTCISCNLDRIVPEVARFRPSQGEELFLRLCRNEGRQE